MLKKFSCYNLLNLRIFLLKYSELIRFNYLFLVLSKVYFKILYINIPELNENIEVKSSTLRVYQQLIFYFFIILFDVILCI